MARQWTGEDQGQRVARAMREAFTFRASEDGAWICESESGSSYLVRERMCGCEDHQYRSGPAGGLCKHRVALGQFLIARGLLLIEQPSPRPKSISLEDAAFARIFG